MKTLRLLLILAAIIAAMTARADRLSRIGLFVGGDPSVRDETAVPAKIEERVIKVSQVDTPAKRTQLITLFETVSKTYTVDADGQAVLKPSSKAAKTGGTILQRLSPTKFLMEGNFLLVVNEPKEWVDGDYVSPRPFVADGIYEFTTVTGAKRSVRQMKEAKEMADITKDQFIETLKNGQEIAIDSEEVKRCDKCLGKGQVHGDGSKGEDESKFKSCPKCRGRGEYTLKLIYVFKW